MREWIESIKPWLEKGTPVTLLLMAILGGITLYYQNEEVKRIHESQEMLVKLLLEERDKRVELALHCAGIVIPK